MSKRVLILGGGYTALWAYRSLARRLRRPLKRGEVELTVVTLDNFHAFHGWTGEVLSGIIPVQHSLAALRPLMPRANLIHGEVELVDTERQSVQVRLVGDETTVVLGYDHLLVATGSRDHLSTVPGLTEYGHRLKRPGDMIALRSHLIQVLERAEATRVAGAAALHSPDAPPESRYLHAVVAGGGFAGVEMSATIMDLVRASRRYYPVLRNHRFRITLIHRGEALLPQLRPQYAKLADYATRQLERDGVEIALGTELAEVTPEGAHLSDGRFIPAATVLSTVGQTLRPLPGLEGFGRDEQGRLLTERDLRVAGTSNLWAGGDVANVTHAKSGRPCPANALWAIKQGVRVGDNIARAILGRETRPFTYPGLGQAASLGIGRGIAELYGLQFTGLIGWLMRLCFFLAFMPARTQAVRVLFDWLTLPVLGRHLQPLDSVERFH